MNRSFGLFLVHASLVILTVVGLLGLFLVEVFASYPLSAYHYLLFGSVWAGLLLVRVGFRLQRLHRILLLAMICLLVVFYVTPWSTRKPFLRKFNRIHEGMSREEVIQMMAGYRSFSLGDALLFESKKGRRFDSDEGKVYFENNAVLNKKFLPD